MYKDSFADCTEPAQANPVRLEDPLPVGAEKRITNLMNLNVDTSWYVRYRSTTNPDFGATFPQAITISNRPAIPITNAMCRIKIGFR